MRPLSRWIVALALVAFFALTGGRRSWEAVRSDSSGRDYATYHYAVQEAIAGGDPYDSKGLGRRARKEGTRSAVHPFFYPPPFLLGMVWVRALSLHQGAMAFYAVNLASLAGVGLALWRWLRPDPRLLAIVLATLTPIADSCKMGQANLPVLLLTVLGLGWTRGLFIGVAGMAKMSPALYLVGWGARGWWRPVAVGAATAVGLSLLALPLVPLQTQLHFYTDVLPGMATGSYNGLRVPITLPANHSIPDLMNQLWPGESNQVLSATAQRASSVLSLVGVGALAVLGRRARDPLGEAALAGAWTVLLLITPVYTYEHHLSLVILPAVALGMAGMAGRLQRPIAVLGLISYFFVAWPLSWLRDLQHLVPAATWWLQESKFFGLVGMGLACVLAARRSPRA